MLLKQLTSRKKGIIYFGRYPQTADGKKKPIEWIVLDKYDSNTLLISKYALITSPYIDMRDVPQDPPHFYFQWKYCAARKACMDFFNEAFSAKEKSMIDVINSKELCDDCEDHVFLLSESDVIKYFPSPCDRQAQPSDYAKKTGARCGWAGQEAFTSWWIKPHIDIHESELSGTVEIDGKKCKYFAFPKAVFHSGEIQFHSRNLGHSDFTIRPCILMRNHK